MAATCIESAMQGKFHFLSFHLPEDRTFREPCLRLPATIPHNGIGPLCCKEEPEFEMVPK